MNPEQLNKSTTPKLLRCRFYHYGCTDLFLPSQLSEHYKSEAHCRSIIKRICTERIGYEEALVDLTMDPIGVEEPLTPAAMTSNNYSVFMERLTNFFIEIEALAILTDTASNNLITEAHDSIHSVSRSLIQQMDRSSDSNFNLQGHQQERQLNEIAMNLLVERLNEVSSDENHHPEQDQGPPSANEQTAIDALCTRNALLKMELDSKPVSMDGHLIWHVKKNEIKKGLQYINSSKFQTSMEGHQLWARLRLHRTPDQTFISFHVRLYRSELDNFHGTIKFILVDQSTNSPLQHRIQICSGEMKYVNDRLGFDDFIDINTVLKEGNSYVRNDAVYFLVCIEQSDEEKFAHLPPNVRHALAAARSMH